MVYYYRGRPVVSTMVWFQERGIYGFFQDFSMHIPYFITSILCYHVDIVWTFPFFFQFASPLFFLFSLVIQNFVSYREDLIGTNLLIMIGFLFCLLFCNVILAVSRSRGKSSTKWCKCRTKLFVFSASASSIGSRGSLPYIR